VACKRLAGGARRELAGDGQQGLPCTIRNGESTEMKRRTRGTHLGAQNRGRGADEGDRGGAAELRRLLRCGGAAHKGKGGGVVRGEEEVVLPLL
jgi:hypothetical protein